MAESPALLSGAPAPNVPYKIPKVITRAPQNEESGLGREVAQHYNELKEVGLAKRTESRIFYMRNLNNWIKSMLINESLQRIRDERGRDAHLTVLDLGSGKGGDLLKWRKGHVKHVVLTDIAETSVEQSQSRYKEMQERAGRERNPDPVPNAQFIVADSTKQRLQDLYQDKNIQFDLTSCQFAFHYGFESYPQAEMILRNACESLRPGGYFIGTTPNAFEIVKRLQNSPDMTFGNDIYRVTFSGDEKKNLPLFGAMYDFHLEGVVDCPEFLVYFPVLEKMAQKFNMKLVYRKTFSEFFEEQQDNGEGRALLGRMQALEGYPAEDGIELCCDDKSAYSCAQEAIDRLSAQPQTDEDVRRNRKHCVGTISSPEWDATNLYCVFAFQKQISEDEASSSGSDSDQSGS